MGVACRLMAQAENMNFNKTFNFPSNLISTHCKHTALSRRSCCLRTMDYVHIGCIFRKKKCFWYKGIPPITLIYVRRKILLYEVHLKKFAFLAER